MDGPEEWACKENYDKDEEVDESDQCRHKYTKDDYDADYGDYLYDMRRDDD